MSNVEAYVGEIRMFAGSFAPFGWELCNGQIIAVSNNDALFSLLGTTYGGDGINTFALPDLRGRIPVHNGNGSGLSPRTLGMKFGQETVTLTVEELPKHTHQFMASSNSAARRELQEQVLAKTVEGDNFYTDGGDDNDTTLNSGSIGLAGQSAPHHNMMPYLGINFIIATVGMYPSRH